MGVKLVGLALTKWAPHVPDRAFRVLVRMAHTALDEPNDKYEAEVFFGGQDLLVSVLRAERYGSLKALEKALERAIKDLVEIGAIERTNKPRAGRRAEYRLTLFNTPRIDVSPVDNPPQPDTHVGAQPDTHVGAQPDTHVPSSPTPTWGPRSKEEPLEELHEEQVLDVGDQVTVARATDDTQTETANPTPKCREPTCAKGFILTDGEIAHCPRCQPNVIPLRRTG